jgi:hypothetical protein
MLFSGEMLNIFVRKVLCFSASNPSFKIVLIGGIFPYGTRSHIHRILMAEWDMLRKIVHLSK